MQKKTSKSASISTISNNHSGSYAKEIEEALSPVGFANSDILIVDDDDDICNLLELILSHDGYRTQRCNSGADAIALAKKQSASLILLDILMPDMDGFETCERLKADPRTRDIPIIFLTGLTSTEEETRGFEVGGLDYIIKPINPNIVLARIKTHLELKHYRDNLEQLVEKRTNSLNQTLEQLTQSQRVKDDFLSLINHELRTPLNGIKGSLALLKDVEISNESKDLIDIANHSLINLTELVENILVLSESIAETLVVVEQSFNIQESLSETLKQARKLAKLKGLQFDCKIDDNIPSCIQSDPILINLLLNHLIGNAIRYTPLGSISVHINANPQQDQSIGTGNKAVNLVLKVMDTGTGISKEKLSTIGEQFSQADRTDNRQFDGLGIGLSVCQSILTVMNGFMSLESQVKKGSSFTAEIPIALTQVDNKVNNKTATISDSAQAVIGANNLSQEQEQEQEQKTILIVEDNSINLLVAKQIVKKCGHQVLTANDGRDAIALLEKSEVDLILMDCQMPQMDGYETTEYIRSREDCEKHLPIIAVTANATAANRKHCMSAGMNDYIQKPISMDSVRFKLGKWLADDGKL